MALKNPHSMISPGFTNSTTRLELAKHQTIKNNDLFNYSSISALTSPKSKNLWGLIPELDLQLQIAETAQKSLNRKLPCGPNQAANNSQQK